MAPRLINDPPAPGTDEWRSILSASKIAAVLGISPWQSPYSLACEMTGLIPPSPVDEKMQDIFDYGHAAEHGMAAYWKMKNPDWDITEGEVAYMDDDLPFPLLVTVDRVVTHKETGKQRILEMKTAQSMDSINKWGKPGEENSVPPHYAVQHLTQMGASGIHQGTVIMTGLGVPEMHYIKWTPIAWGRIVSRCKEFWELIQDGRLPELDDSVATFNAVRGLHPDIDRDSVYVVDEELALRLLRAKEMEQQGKEQYREARIELMDKMGDKHRAVLDGTVVAQRQGSKNGVNLITKATVKDITE